MRNFRKFLTLATVSFLGAIGAANAGEWGTSYGAMTLPDEPTPGAVRGGSCAKRWTCLVAGARRGGAAEPREAGEPDAR